MLMLRKKGTTEPLFPWHHLLAMREDMEEVQDARPEENTSEPFRKHLEAKARERIKVAAEQEELARINAEAERVRAQLQASGQLPQNGIHALAGIAAATTEPESKPEVQAQPGAAVAPEETPAAAGTNSFDVRAITDKGQLKALLADRGIRLPGTPTIETMQKKLLESLNEG